MINIMLAANIRDEKNMREWIVHHCALGFSHLLLFDHQFPQVQVLRIEKPTIRKKDLMTRALQMAKKKEIEWLLYLDADEFLVLPQHPDVSSFLASYSSTVHQIGIHWLLFGSNGHDDDPLVGTILENFTRREEKLSPIIKAFVRCQWATRAENPHVWDTDNLVDVDGISKNNGKGGGRERICTVMCPSMTRALIAHYSHQSYETYRRRKLERVRDDTGAFRDPIPRDQFHKKWNVVEDTTIRDLYNERNKLEMSRKVDTDEGSPRSVEDRD